MALRFRPMPGLTLAVLICLPILIGLGVWQYQRWQWKLGVLEEVEAAVTAPPIEGLAALTDALSRGEALDFRRIEITARATGPIWYLYRPAGGIQWQPFQEIVSETERAMAGFPTIDDRVKSQSSTQTAKSNEVMTRYAGYVRRIRPRTGMARWVGSPNSPDENRWFEINPDGAWMSGVTHYIDVDSQETDADGLPIRRPDIANNHVSYMLTWWSFALIMLIIYAILHRRAGRLSW